MRQKQDISRNIIIQAKIQLVILINFVSHSAIQACSGGFVVHYWEIYWVTPVPNTITYVYTVYYARNLWHDAFPWYVKTLCLVTGKLHSKILNACDLWCVNIFEVSCVVHLVALGVHFDNFVTGEALQSLWDGLPRARAWFLAKSYSNSAFDNKNKGLKKPLT